MFSRRAAIDVMRKERRSPLPTEPPPPPPDLDRSLYVQELLELLDDERSAEVVRSSYLEGMSAKEVAAKLRLSPGNVRVLRYRALEAIRAKSTLDDYADQVEPL